jgi:LytS/YehU family sensor histidine kinase
MAVLITTLLPTSDLLPRLLSIAIAIGIIYLIVHLRVNAERAKGIAKKREVELKQVKAEFARQIAESEMSALRAQMNPHFIFNVLNSINRYIMMNDSEVASRYLTQFARLIRLVLENSKTAKVSLEADLEALKLYINMEKLRFLDKFDYRIEIEEGIDQQFTQIPPLLMQPYVENAIWHGLMQQADGGLLQIKMRLKQEHILLVMIEDNGIGRQQSALLKSKTALSHKSHGLQMTKDRIAIVNRLYGIQTEVAIEDLKSPEGQPTGTRVTLTIPI